MKLRDTWHVPTLQQDVTMVRYGYFGLPVLLFPTAGGDAEECERMQMIRALQPLLAAGRIKIYSIDSVGGRAWTNDHYSGGHRAYVQNQYDRYIYEDVLPAIYKDCNSNGEIPIVTAGASIGAFNALASLCRHPDAFHAAVCMSGTYDLSRWMKGEHTTDFHFSSPLHFLPYLDEGQHLDVLRQRMVILPTGEGRWEDPDESWKVAHTLGSRGIPNRVDLWGQHYDHCWETWREMLPLYLDDIA